MGYLYTNAFSAISPEKRCLIAESYLWLTHTHQCRSTCHHQYGDGENDNNDLAIVMGAANEDGGGGIRGTSGAKLTGIG